MKRLMTATAMLACAPFASSATADRNAPPEWASDAVFYEMFVRSFADSTEGPLANDGVGDFRGAIERLDYLNDGNPDTTNDLGITALWLMPVFQSPSYHGYDVTDYLAIDDEYGTLNDFKAFLDACHERGIRVILDMIPNHTSNEHPWFLESINPNSDKHDWFVWSERPLWDGVWNDNQWHDQHRDQNGKLYYGVFWHGMPDLNQRNEDVERAFHDAVRYWIADVGIDGFRLDAVRYIVESRREREDHPDTIEWLARFDDACEAASEQAFTVSEVWADNETIARYVPEATDSAFYFPLADAILETVRSGKPDPVRNAMAAAERTFDEPVYSTFLRNHDQPRTMTEVEGDAEAARLAAAIQLLLPGIPFIYYGEEIGMTGGKPDPNIRTPMQWTGDRRRAGFTNARPWRDPQTDTPQRNVNRQTRDKSSLLSAYRELIHFRNASPAIRRGEYQPLSTTSPTALAFRRTDTASGEDMIILVNPTDRIDRRVSIDLPSETQFAGRRLTIGRAAREATPINQPGGDRSRTAYTMQPMSAVVIEVQR